MVPNVGGEIGEMKDVGFWGSEGFRVFGEVKDLGFSVSEGFFGVFLGFFFFGFWGSEGFRVLGQ